MATSFRPFEEDFLRITADIVWCTLTTVDRKGRPRSRVVHPIFTVADGQPVGWLLTGRTPVKQADRGLTHSLRSLSQEECTVRNRLIPAVTLAAATQKKAHDGSH